MSHKDGSTASPPTRTVAGRAAPVPAVAASTARRWEGVQSNTSTRCSARWASSSPPWWRISSGTRHSVCPAASWISCLTEASKVSGAFTATRSPGPASAWTVSCSARNRCATARCSTTTGRGAPVEPEVKMMYAASSGRTFGSAAGAGASAEDGVRMSNSPASPSGTPCPSGATRRRAATARSSDTCRAVGAAVSSGT